MINREAAFSLKRKATCLISETFPSKVKVRRSVFVINREAAFSLKRKATFLTSQTFSIKGKVRRSVFVINREAVFSIKRKALAKPSLSKQKSEGRFL